MISKMGRKEPSKRELPKNKFSIEEVLSDNSPLITVSLVRGASELVWSDNFFRFLAVTNLAIVASSIVRGEDQSERSTYSITST